MGSLSNTLPLWNMENPYRQKSITEINNNSSNKMEKVCRFCTADSLPVRMTQLVLFVLAGLVGNAAAGLAGRLAGSLALAAAALLRTCTQITRLQCLNPLHNTYPPNIIISGVAKRPPFCTQSIPYRQGQVNEKNLKRKSFFRAPHGNR